MLKQLSLLALAGHAIAQNTPTLAEALNATAELSTLGTVLALNPELVQALSSAQNITILAPSNDAFGLVPNETLQALQSDLESLAALLQYHVLNGTVRAADVTNTSTFVPTLLTDSDYTQVTGGQVVEAITSGENVVFYSGLLDNATVSTADVNFTGGVIHIIDRVLTIPQDASDTALAAGLTSLAGVLTEYDLVDAVESTPNITVFAPSNAAFQAIAGGLGNLSESDIQNILTYHVINGTIAYSSGLENGTVVAAANGEDLTITIIDGGVFVNNARVISTDVLIENGVVHVIDAVLNPGNATIADPSATAGSPAFGGAAAGTEEPFTSGLPSASRSIGTQPTPTGGAAGESGAPSQSQAVAPRQTAAIGMGALLGAAAVYFL